MNACVTKAAIATIILMVTMNTDTTAASEDVENIPESEEAKEFTDISWMGTNEKKILENFITYYKLALQTAANVLNPKAWNLDIVMPAIGGVIRLYTGPLLALAIILFLYSTITTFVEGILTNRNGRSMSYNFGPTLDALAYVVQNAINKQFEDYH
ncbi:uncharacterized protein [Macrobrachium rosenbergii]|uniref:uncharacterized protein n=1 Tax=Macrobrachium rosenbergii TaxID=79674 RepID=UPI0034D4749C